MVGGGKPTLQWRQGGPAPCALAERVGFEPTVPCDTPDFESGTIDHSVTSPCRGPAKLSHAPGKRKSKKAAQSRRDFSRTQAVRLDGPAPPEILPIGRMAGPLPSRAARRSLDRPGALSVPNGRAVALHAPCGASQLRWPVASNCTCRLNRGPGSLRLPLADRHKMNGHTSSTQFPRPSSTLPTKNLILVPLLNQWRQPLEVSSLEGRSSTSC